jgi:mannose-6-phosphate isomerase-like protein (cupin superfamily)
MTNTPRRVIAGLDANGKSCVVSEDAIPQAASEGMAITTITTGPIGRTDNSRALQPGFAEFSMSQLTDAVYSMMFATYPPGLGKDDPGMHFTNTADHFYIIEGECVLVLESGEAVLRAGDVGICRGVMHGWRNDTDRPCRLVTFVLPAEPL